MNGRTGSGRPILSVDHVDFAYRGTDKPIFNDLSLDVPRGQFLCVVGPSGCGKSTLLRLLAGLLAPGSGEVTINGEPMHGPSAAISVVFQSDTLLPWRKALNNVQLGLEGRASRSDVRRRSMDMLKLVGLEGEESKYPHQLSGGMRQRVNLARALVVDPDVLVLDEPFAALDAQTREAQQENLLAVWEQQHKTVIFVTHDIDEAVFLADRVVVLGRAPRGIVHDTNLALPRPRSLKVKAGDLYRNEVQNIRDIIIASGSQQESPGDL